MLILMGVAADTALRVRRTRIVVTKSKRVALRGAGLSTRRTGVTIAGEVQCDDYANWAIGRFSSRDAGAPPPRPGARTRRPGSPTRRPPAAPDMAPAIRVRPILNCIDLGALGLAAVGAGSGTPRPGARRGGAARRTRPGRRGPGHATVPASDAVDPDNPREPRTLSSKRPANKLCTVTQTKYVAAMRTSTERAQVAQVAL